MNRKKWQGMTCLLLASLMVSSVFAAPVRKETAPQTTTMPKATTAPQATTTPKATTAPQATTMPKATTAPQATTMPKATTAPQATTMPQATTTPQAITMPKATTAPQATTMPKKEMVPNKSDCTKQHQDEKNAEKQKPFTLDHFKMITNALKKMGVSENQIVSYIKDGKKLEDILKAEKISTKKFKKCITKEYFKVVDEAVNNGQITTEQSKQLKGAIKETIKNWLPKK